MFLVFLENIDLFEKITSWIFGILTSIVVIRYSYLYKSQHHKSRSEILEKFEKAIDTRFSHSVTELFWMLHGLRMSYTDIISIAENNDCSKMIFVLKQTPGLVEYKNNELQYTKQHSDGIMFFFGKVIPILFFVFFAILLVATTSLAVLTMGSSSYSYWSWLMVVGSSICLSAIYKQIQYYKLIKATIVSSRNF